MRCYWKCQFWGPLSSKKYFLNCLSTVCTGVRKGTLSIYSKFATNILSTETVQMHEKGFLIFILIPLLAKNPKEFGYLGQKEPLGLPTTWFKPHLSQNSDSNLKLITMNKLLFYSIIIYRIKRNNKHECALCIIICFS